jgi:hypothetical protein
MRVDDLSGSTVAMLNHFMESKEESLLMEERLHLKGYGKDYYLSFVIGRMLKPIDDRKMASSHIILSDLKKVMGKTFDVELNERILKEGRLCVANVSLPVYALLKKTFETLQSHSSDENETLIEFDRPIELNAQCHKRDFGTWFQHYGQTSSFPIIGIMTFRDLTTASKYERKVKEVKEIHPDGSITIHEVKE